MNEAIKVTTPEDLAGGSGQIEKMSAKNKIRGLIDSRKEAIERALPKLVDPKRFIQVVMTAVASNPKLLECTPASLLGSILTAAQLGLELDPILGHAYLVPYWNPKKKCSEAQFQAGYKGLVELALRSEKVLSIASQVIYEGDYWNYEYTTDGDVFTHRPALSSKDRGEKVVGAWARAKLANGVSQFDVMSTEDIEEIRNRSKSGQSPAWRNSWNEMAKKTVVKRLAKLIPQAADLHRYSAQEDAVDIGVAVVDSSGDEQMIVPANSVIDIPPESDEKAPVESVNEETGEVIQDEGKQAEFASQCAKYGINPEDPDAEDKIEVILGEIADAREATEPVDDSDLPMHPSASENSPRGGRESGSEGQGKLGV